MADRVAWILLAVLFAGLFVALISGGWSGPGGAGDWWRSKFLGQPR